MQARLPVWIVELSKLPGNEIDSALFDTRVEPYPETEVCAACKIAAAFEIRERLKSYNKRFINLDSSPYLSKIGRILSCTCKRPTKH